MNGAESGDTALSPAPPPESSTLPVSPVEPDVFTSQFGRGSQFGLEKLLQIFGLLPWDTETDLKQVRHRLGWCGATMCTLKIPYVFMQLQTTTRPLPPTPKRQVVRSNRARRANSYKA